MAEPWPTLPRDVRGRVFDFLRNISANSREVDWPMAEWDVCGSVSSRTQEELERMRTLVVEVRAPDADLKFERSARLAFALRRTEQIFERVTLVVPEHEPVSAEAAMSAFLAVHPELAQRTGTVEMVCLRGVEVRSAFAVVQNWREAFVCDVWQMISELVRSDCFVRAHPDRKTEGDFNIRLMCCVSTEELYVGGIARGWSLHAVDDAAAEDARLGTFIGTSGHKLGSWGQYTAWFNVNAEVIRRPRATAAASEDPVCKFITGRV